MPVCTERDPDRAMAQVGGHLLDIKPFGDQETRARMPQIVRSDVADTGPGRDLIFGPVSV